MKLRNPYNEYRVDGNCWNYIEAMFEDTSAMNGDGPWFQASADTVCSSLSVPVNKTSFTTIMIT